VGKAAIIGQRAAGKRTDVTGIRGLRGSDAGSFVHQNFPGQYLHLARHLDATRGNQVVCITQRRDANLRTVIDLYDLCSLAPPTQLHLLKEATEPTGPYVWTRKGT
jgi:hypothetical protein